MKKVFVMSMALLAVATATAYGATMAYWDFEDGVAG